VLPCFHYSASAAWQCQCLRVLDTYSLRYVADMNCSACLRCRFAVLARVRFPPVSCDGTVALMLIMTRYDAEATHRVSAVATHAFLQHNSVQTRLCTRQHLTYANNLEAAALLLAFKFCRWDGRVIAHAHVCEQCMTVSNISPAPSTSCECHASNHWSRCYALSPTHTRAACLRCLPCVPLHLCAVHYPSTAHVIRHRQRSSIQV
jgi:hypothetical protein